MACVRPPANSTASTANLPARGGFSEVAAWRGNTVPPSGIDTPAGIPGDTVMALLLGVLIIQVSFPARSSSASTRGHLLGADRELKAIEAAIRGGSRPGASRNIGTDVIANADTDGYTLLLVIDMPITVNPTLNSLSIRPASIAAGRRSFPGPASAG